MAKVQTSLKNRLEMCRKFDGCSRIGWRGEETRDRAVVELDAVDVKRINSIRADLDLAIVDGRAGIMNWDAVR